MKYKDTFKAFQKEELQNLKEFLVSLSDQLIKTRLTQSVLNQYKKSFEKFKQTKELICNASPNENSMASIKLQMYTCKKCLQELRDIDFIVLNIMKDITIRAK